MERGVVIALIAVGLVMAAIVGLGLGLAVLASDPAIMALRNCSSGHMGPPGGCHNFRITARTADRADFTYDLADGSHCVGYEQVHRRGPLGLAIGGSGAVSCSSPGQPLPGRPAPPTAFPDGNLPCVGAVSFAGPASTATGFQVRMTNTSPATCDVSGPAKVLFLDSSGRPLNVTNRPADEAAGVVVLAAGSSALFDFDLGSSGCQKPARMVVIAASASQQLPSPAVVCGPVISHPARAAPSAGESWAAATT